MNNHQANELEELAKGLDSDALERVDQYSRMIAIQLLKGNKNGAGQIARRYYAGPAIEGFLVESLASFTSNRIATLFDNLGIRTIEDVLTRPLAKLKGRNVGDAIVTQLLLDLLRYTVKRCLVLEQQL